MLTKKRINIRKNKLILTIIIFLLNNIKLVSSYSVYIDPSSACGASCTGSLLNPSKTIMEGVSVHTSIMWWGGTVFLQPGLYIGPNNMNIVFASAGINFKGMNGPANSVIDCQGLYFGYKVQNGNFQFEDITIKNCRRTILPDINGAAIFGQAVTLILINSFFEDNQANGNGGAVYITDGTLTITNCIFENNFSQKNGGALYITQGTGNIQTSSKFLSNTASLDGGGIFLNMGQLQVTDNINILLNSLTSGANQMGCLQGQINLKLNCIYTEDFTCDQCIIQKKCDISEALCSPKCYCPKQYFDLLEDKCKPCHDGCYECSGALNNQCISCYSNAYLSSSNECICDQHYYCINPPCANLCLPCDSSCDTCDGPGSNQCITCSLGKVLVSGNCILCHPSCTLCSGPLISDCIYTCHSTCQTCSGSLISDCNTCFPNAFIAGSIPGPCLCNSNYYCLNPPCSDNCIQCDNNCQTCNGPSDCTLCNNNYNLVSGVCILNCMQSCDTCSGPLATNCLQCFPNAHILNNGECGCNDGYFCSGENCENNCLQCNSQCKTCQGPLDSECTSCLEGFSLEIGSCLKKHECEENYFFSIEQNICKQCHDSCLNCFSELKNNCLSCKNNFYLDSNSCVQKCSSNKYGDKKTKTCEICDLSCKTCDEKTENDCLSCINLKKIYYGKCIEECPLQTIYDSLDNKCIKCDLNCKNCSSSTVCSKCDDEFFLKDGKCFKISNYLIELNEIKKNILYEIKLLQNSETLFNDIKLNLEVDIPNLNINDFEFCIENNYIDDKILDVIIDYNINEIPKNLNLKIILNKIKNPFKILNEQTTFPMVEGETSSYLNTLNNSRIYINEIESDLEYTKRLTKIKFNFQGLNFFNNEFCIQLNKSIIFIEDFENEIDFSYILECEGLDSIFINFFYLKNLLNRKLLRITYNFSHSYLKRNDLKLLNSFNEIYLFEVTHNDYYYMEYLNIHANSYYFAWPIKIFEFLYILMKKDQDSNNNNFRNLMLVELIVLLKFIDLNYPQNLREFFLETSNHEMKIFYNYKFEKKYEDKGNIPKLFAMYNITPYFLDYAGDQIFQNIIFYLIALIFLLIKKLTNKEKILKLKKHPYLLIIFYHLNHLILALQKAFVWDFTLFIFVTNYQFILLKSFISCHFRTFQSPESKFNTLFAYIVLLCSILSLFFLAYIIKKATAITFQVSPMIGIEKKGNENLSYITPIDSSSPGKDSSKISEKSNNSPPDIFSKQKKPENTKQKTRISSDLCINTNKNYEKIYLNDNEYQKGSTLGEKSEPQTSEQNIVVKELVTPIPIVIERMKNKDVINETKDRLDLPVNISAERIEPHKDLKNKKFWKSSDKNSTNTEENEIINEKNIKIKKNNNHKKFSIRNSIFGKKNDDTETIYRSNSFSIVFSDFKLHIFFGRYFTILDLLRQFIIAFITIIFIKFAFFQICCINAIQLLYFFIVVIKIRPFKTLICFINFIFVEIVVFVAFFSCLLIEIEPPNLNDKINLGKVVPICNIILIYWIFMIILSRIIISIDEKIRKKKKNK